MTTSPSACDSISFLSIKAKFRKTANMGYPQIFSSHSLLNPLLLGGSGIYRSPKTTPVNDNSDLHIAKSNDQCSVLILTDHPGDLCHNFVFPFFTFQKSSGTFLATPDLLCWMLCISLIF